ncbi:unnamed protein product [Allacma fusca]|uniref:CCHC-type domain-containing protein n=1 Tax=Allacma fusca TaxID=39272 RepID=A0A8J2K5Z3_9HEXA|nr:unnamed protein product [Allacma fusca]
MKFFVPGMCPQNPVNAEEQVAGQERSSPSTSTTCNWTHGRPKTKTSGQSTSQKRGTLLCNVTTCTSTSRTSISSLDLLRGMQRDLDAGDDYFQKDSTVNNVSTTAPKKGAELPQVEELDDPKVDNVSPRLCHRCKKPGHIAKDCYSRLPDIQTQGTLLKYKCQIPPNLFCGTDNIMCQWGNQLLCETMYRETPTRQGGSKPVLQRYFVFEKLNTSVILGCDFLKKIKGKIWFNQTKKKNKVSDIKLNHLVKLSGRQNNEIKELLSKYSDVFSDKIGHGRV